MEEDKTIRMGEEGDFTPQTPPEEAPTVYSGPPDVGEIKTPPSMPREPGWGPPPPSPWTPPPPTPPTPGVPPAPEAGKTILIGREARPTKVLAWLAVADGPHYGHIFQLKPDSTTIGRVPGNDIVLSWDDTVSRQHARIKVEPREEGEPAFVIYDMASANGVFVGDKETYRDNQVYRHELKDGDYILIGETTLVFKKV